MDIAVKKVELIEWLARLQDEKLILRIETLKNGSMKELYEQRMPKAMEELEAKLSQSEKDIKEGKVYSQEEVERHFKARFKSWRKRKFIWSDEALSDLETIYDFLAENFQPAAQRIVESILSKSRQLESFPESGAMQQTLVSTDKGYRYLVEGNYKIVYSYQPESQTVHVALIFDTRSNPEELKV